MLLCSLVFQVTQGSQQHDEGQEQGWGGGEGREGG